MQVEQFVSGKWVKQYQYSSFSPTLVNREWFYINTLLEQAARALAELNALLLVVPDVGLFIRIHITKEANTELLGVSYQTALTLMQQMEAVSILKETTGHGRNRLYVFKVEGE